MKKRVLCLVLSLAMLLGALPLAASAIPYAPSANAWKDFGQQHIYMYEVNKGNAAPKMDGYLTDADGYGEPIATYGFRYCTTADSVTPSIDKGEFKLRPDGTYYVYPTENSSQEVWDAITSIETDSPYGYIWSYYIEVTSFSATSSYLYQDPDDMSFKNAFFVTNDAYKNGTYEVLNSKKQYKLKNYKKLAEKPADWETNFASYYTCPEDFLPVEPTEEGKAPEFVENKYYTGDRIPATRFYQTTEGNSSSVAQVSNLKLNHVILPEKINVYARYDSEYLYYAIEVVETRHQTAHYKTTFYYGTNMSNVLAVYGGAFDFAGNITKKCYGTDTEATIATRPAMIRTFATTTSQLLDIKNVLRKYGNLDVTDIKDVTKVGVDYNITHSNRVEPVVEEEPEEEEDFLGGSFEIGGGSSESDDLSSGYYGTTVYEYRQPWKVINGKYSGTGSAVPSMFTCRGEIQLENSLCPDTFYFSFTLPRESRALPGSILRDGGNYPDDLAMMRYANPTGLTEGEKFGTYNFMWAVVSSSYANWEYYLTDYSNIAKRKKEMIAHIPPVFFTAGQEPAEGYVQPDYYGANIRADGAENQKMRIQFTIPNTEKEIEEAGVIIAPTEVARRNQLKLGISSIAYYGEEYTTFYGVDENGNWVNMPEDADKYFADSATPNDSDSYVAVDELGGKPNGIYTVYTLAADLTNPYGKHKDPETLEELGDIYTVVFGGPNGEGLYHDFDDFFTFYTIRPYIKYKDGTVTYGEHEYKSVYYLACWTIQDMISAYNEQANGAAAVAEQYNMDQMPLTTVKDSSGNTLKDAKGNTLYVPATSVDGAISCYAGGAEKSIYYPERRLEVFRWYAVRTLNRINAASLRVEYYDDFSDDVKAKVNQYVEMYENIWNVVVTTENTRYVIMK